MGYEVSCYYPRRNSRPLYTNLVATLELLGVELLEELPAADSSTVLIDAVFGFSFRPPLRPPFGGLIEEMGRRPNVVSVDVPSGWDIDAGPTHDAGVALHPDVLISLTLPKRCARSFSGGSHYLGKVFLPQAVAEARGLARPAFAGAQQIVRL
jgi:hydroxyethylthiazole kinase-like uncharacterized protein yjeF